MKYFIIVMLTSVETLYVFILADDEEHAVDQAKLYVAELNTPSKNYYVIIREITEEEHDEGIVNKKIKTLVQNYRIGNINAKQQ